MNISQHNPKKAFTLIELLVVIAIIGLLSAVVLASLNVARAKGRDAQRLSDLKQLQNALELYATSNNGSYPVTSLSHAFIGNCSAFGSKPNTGLTGWVPGLAPTYISVLPTDPAAPLSKDGAYAPSSSCYIYASDGNNYKLTAFSSDETYTIGNAGYPNPNPARGTSADFSLYTSAASSW